MAARPRALALGLLLAAGCARPPWCPTDAREEGAAFYRRACASCHGGDGRGGGPVAKALGVPVPDLTGLAARNGGSFPRQHVMDVIVGRQEMAAHGTREMPVWGERFGGGAGNVASLYARRRIELLADHLGSLQASP